MPEEAPEEAPEEVPEEVIEAWRHGVRIDVVAPQDAASHGLLVIDLGDAWAPSFLRPDPTLGEAGDVAWYATYIALAGVFFNTFHKVHIHLPFILGRDGSSILTFKKIFY